MAAFLVLSLFFIVPIWQGLMSSIIVFIVFKGVGCGLLACAFMPTTPNEKEKEIDRIVPSMKGATCHETMMLLQHCLYSYTFGRLMGCSKKTRKKYRPTMTQFKIL